MTDSVVRWNGSNRPTTFVSSGQLLATVTATDIASNGTAQVAVSNPSPGGGLSASLTLTILAPTPAPTGLNPGSATAGGPGFTLRVTGNGFAPTSVVRWNGSNRSTTYVGGTELRAAIGTGDIATAGTALVTVFTPSPGGGLSGALPFSITAAAAPSPTVTTLTPASTTAGGAAFTLTVNGGGFVATSVVRWNGSDRATTYVGGTELRAAIGTGDIATAGTALVTVFTPSPGGGLSGALIFTIAGTPPTITGLTPSSATAGGPALALAVDGTGFVSGATVLWNGAARSTTFVSATRVTASIGAVDIAAAASASVTVRNPDLQVSGARTFSITPQPTGELIIDNAAAGVQDAAGGRTFTGTWCVSGATNQFGADSLFSCSSSGTDTYRWTPNLTTAGTYDVYVWWTTHVARGTAVPVSVVHASGTSTVNFNEQVGGGQWVLHGRYAFNAGTGGNVQVAGTPVQQAAADAVKLVPAAGNPLPVASTLSPSSATAGGPAFTLTVNGSGFVTGSVVRWNGADRSTTFVSETQLRASIGSADIATAGTGSVTVFNPTPGGGVSASLPFTIVGAQNTAELIIDNAAAGVQDAAGGRTFTGTWCASGATNQFGADSLFSCSSSGTDTYRWTPNLTAAGTYDVYVWWTTHVARGTAVPVSVVHANGTSTVNFNEQVGGGQWVLHGQYTFSAGTSGYVQSAGTPTQQSAADAVKFVLSSAGSRRFSGPYETPFICMTQQAGLGPALDANCSAPTITQYWYRTTGGVFQPLADPTQRPGDLSQAVVNGQSVPFIVRVEKGTINRSIYEIARLDDAAGWNGRLIYVFGGGCEGGWYIQGSATGGVLDDVMLGRGYATASASLNVFETNCNDVLAAETMAMVKDRFVAEFGAPAFTIGWGCSGGSYQAHQIGDNYPGLLDGIIVGCSFPDVTSATILTVTDASLLQHYFASTTGWTAEQKRAVAGFAQAEAVDTLAPRAVRIDPDAGCNAAIPPEWRYNAATNPAGARCDVYDHTVNVYGRDAQTGFARRPLDNVGVQYGLGALNAGVITKQQFLDLNARIGGFDNDGNFSGGRTAGSVAALQAAHETGRVLYGGAGLAGTPIIDYRAYADLVAGGDVHMKIHSFATRERLRQTTGQTANHVMLLEDGQYGAFSLHSPVLVGALGAMDAWLAALVADQSSDSRTVKAARAKPAGLVDACYNGAGQKIAEPATLQGGTCNSLYPTFATPRLVAGAPVVDNVLKCGLKALNPADYAVAFTSTEWTQLQQIFPAGVCDYAQPGSWQVPLRGTWLSY